MSKQKRAVLLPWVSAALLAATSLAAAAPQDQAKPANADTDDTLGEIVVTARKRDERLLDIPISISALSSEALETQGIHSLNDLAKATPGLTLDSTLGGSVRSDRSFNIYVMRGMVPSLTSNPTTTIFVNGAPFVSGQIGGLDDLARVEVLQGPQSAYFGRQTFAGAINLVTRDPSPEFGGSVSALAASDNFVDVRGALEGALVGDSLTARLSGRYFTRDGSYDNQAVAQKSHGTLGDQSTKSGTLQLQWKPTEKLKFDAMMMYWEDDDGPGATAQYEAATSTNCRTAGGYRWYCGSIGPVTAGHPASNDVVDPWIQTIVNTANAAIRSTPGATFTIPDEYGLKRKAYHSSFGFDYQLNSGATVSYLASKFDDQYGTLIDLDNTDTSAVPRPVFYPATSQTFYNFPFYVGSRIEGESHELRLQSSGEQKLKWTVGYNYARNRRDQAIGGLEFNLFFGKSSNSNYSTGFFFGLNYDINDKWSFSVDGRHQRDYQSFPTATSRTSAAFNDITPRLSVQYKISPDVMTYFTYSEGINPGTFNSTQLSDFERQYIAANFAGVFNSSTIVSPEKLKNFEVGLKGRFLNGRLTLTGAIYHDKWTNQITVSTFNVCRDVACTVPNLIANNANNGRSRIQGVEFNVGWVPADNWLLSLAGAINDSEIQSGTFGRAGQIRCGCTTPTIAQQTFNGSQLPNTARTQFTAAVQYGAPLSFGSGDWKWFARLDDSYKSKQFESQDNLASSPALNFMNVRGGISNANWRLEAFIENALDEDGVTNIATVTSLATPFAPPIPDAVFAGLPNLRTYGIRVAYKFGGAAQ